MSKRAERSNRMKNSVRIWYKVWKEKIGAIAETQKSCNMHLIRGARSTEKESVEETSSRRRILALKLKQLLGV